VDQLALSAAFMPFLDAMINRVARGQIRVARGGTGGSGGVTGSNHRAHRQWPEVGDRRWRVVSPPEVGLYYLLGGRDTIGSSRPISIPANRSLRRPAMARCALSGPARASLNRDTPPPRRSPGRASRSAGSVVVARLRAGGDRSAAGQRLEATHVTLRTLLDALGRTSVAFDLRERSRSRAAGPIGGLPARAEPCWPPGSPRNRPSGC
jgi:hypothetical protein